MLKIKKILVPLDLHEEAEHLVLVEAAVDLAQKYGAKLHFVNVVDVDLDSSMIDRFSDIKSEYAGMAQRQLQHIVDKKIPQGIEAEFHVLSGRSYSKIVTAAEDTNADLILVAAHKSRMKRFHLGMTAARVVRHASCSVLVIRTDGN